MAIENFNLEVWLGEVVKGWFYVRNGLVYVKGDILVDSYHIQGEVLPCKFEHVIGNVWMSGSGLETLEGCPRIVSKTINISNNRLTSLEGGPRFVGLNYWCQHNKLETLNGAPKIANGSFHCHHNKLVSLGGSLKVVKQKLDVRFNEFGGEPDHSGIEVGGELLW